MSVPGQVETSPVAEAHRFDEAALAAYLRGHIDGFAGDMSVSQFQAGQSNPTYGLEAGGHRYVLRKKPPGKLLPSAHAVDREYRVMRALRDTGVPVPRALHLCEDPDIIGTEFFVMDLVEGRVFHDPGLPGVSVEERRRFFDDFIRVLATLHNVDFDAVGLGDFGRPAGYLERQVSRWGKQYEASQTEDIPAMAQVMAWLPAHLPEDDSVSIVHGDFRPGNMIAHTSDAGIAAVLDWELSTLGHPLSDLGYCCANYHGEVSSQGNFSKLDHSALGIPTEAEFIDAYCRHSGRDSIPDFAFYVIFSLFRSAAIIQGVYKRGLDGNASSKEALTFGGLARERAETAWALVEERF
jgi:aminoglycoside phosphotransferase (APT) family kinase protein